MSVMIQQRKMRTEVAINRKRGRERIEKEWYSVDSFVSKTNHHITIQTTFSDNI